MRLSLVPKPAEFYELFTAAGANALVAAQKAEVRIREFPNSSVTQADVKSVEHEGDRITRELTISLSDSSRLKEERFGRGGGGGQALARDRRRLELVIYFCQTWTQSTSVSSTSGVVASGPPVQPPAHICKTSIIRWSSVE